MSRPEGEAKRLLTEGDDLMIVGQWSQAAEKYEAALSLFQQHSDSPEETIRQRTGESTALNKLGFAYNNQDCYDKALETFQQSLAISREIGDRHGEAIALWNIGIIAVTNKGDYGQALDSMQQTYTIFESLGLSSEMSEIRDWLKSTLAGIRESSSRAEYEQRCREVTRRTGLDLCDFEICEG